jgi:hypothetical protein
LSEVPVKEIPPRTTKFLARESLLPLTLENLKVKSTAPVEF